MKVTLFIILSMSLLLLSACTFYETRHPEPAPVVHSPKPLAIPLGKNWQIIEEPPNLSEGRGRLPFQTDQSMQPEMAKPVSPEQNRTIETKH